ncbi:MAG: SUMF1/EgtB/PvdO family nonheme iron enzyme [Candidatus Aminicenantes bacterium]
MSNTKFPGQIPFNAEIKGHQVFISYSDEKTDKTGSDRKIADMICSALESENIRCWIDHRDIMPGEKWVNAIFNAVEQSKIMVLVFSENANQSQWVEDEITYALDEKIRIIPFRVENVTPKGALRVLRVRSQWIDAQQPPQQEDLNRLVRAVRTYLEKEMEKPGDLSDVKSKAKKVYKNQKGFQEADLGDGIIMVYIPPGKFKMGSNDYDNEKPPHTIYLDGYWMGKYEVTVKQFSLFVKDTGYVTQAERSGGSYTWTGDKWEKIEGINWKKPRFKQEDNHPVVCVSWIDAMKYCKWLSRINGLTLRLPTEAQWEKAARGTDQRKYPWGNPAPSAKIVNFADKQAWLKEKFNWANKDIDDGYAYTAPVGSYPAGASPYGLLDMAGNVWEWCSDWYDPNYYKSSPKVNPSGPDSGTGRVMRGGSWVNFAGVLSCSFRFIVVPSDRGFNLGFRLCIHNK